MSRIAAILLLFCTVSTSPVLGYWKHEGFTPFNGQPIHEQDELYGTWSCIVDWYGTVLYDMNGSTSEGAIWGDTAVVLGAASDPGALAQGLSRGVSVEGDLGGTTKYLWIADENEDPNDDHWIEIYWDSTIDDGRVDYQGWAIDEWDTMEVACNTRVFGEGYDGFERDTFYAGGQCYGTATEASAYAENTPLGDVAVTSDVANHSVQLDSWGNPVGGYYNGYLYFRGYAESSWIGHALGCRWLTVTTCLSGWSSSWGEVAFTGPIPGFFSGGFGTGSSWHVQGDCSSWVYGDIRMD
jgi:hypothetical protein